MKRKIVVLLITLFLFNSQWAHAEDLASVNLAEYCQTELKSFPGPFDDKVLKEACGKAQVMKDCKSVEGRAIFHYDKAAAQADGKKIFVVGMIHGDETPAGTVSRFWLERLETISPRNTWRIIPILNPDGVKKKTRTNANKIDLNRNFPTKDWDAEAIKYWKTSTSSNPRRFPGNKAASEPETQCALRHMEEFKPDFIVSIHTPLRVLDFDGPKVKPPQFNYLPWKSLGHFPGSLGRYMWFERQTPVLTMELKDDLPPTTRPFEELQDIIGSLVKLRIPSVESPRKELED